ncbi:MAG: energy transducer TonB [Flavobacteriales bacterium]|nr:energy transducer TonB [Flavobacteriales bacterium]
MKLNKARSDEFLKSMESKPSDRMTFVYQAIIVSLIAHIFILFVTQMLTQDNRMAQEDVIYEELDMDMIEPEMIPPPEEQPEESSQMSELKNLIANENAQRTSEEKSYRGMSKAELNEQVYNDLKNMEAQEFAKLNEGRPDYTVQQNQTGKSGEEKPKKSEYDWYRDKANNSSYNGRVTASYNMSGRDALDNPVPTYRCKTQGKVIVLVSINNLGLVTDAKIDEGKSSADECLRSESVKYALKWKFNYKADALKKQDGTITFTFSAQ